MKISTMQTILALQGEGIEIAEINTIPKNISELYLNEETNRFYSYNNNNGIKLSIGKNDRNVVKKNGKVFLIDSNGFTITKLDILERRKIEKNFSLSQLSKILK